MASYYPIRDPDGRIIKWAGSFFLSRPDGTTRRVKRERKTKRECQIVITDLERKANDGIDIAKKPPTVKQILEDWLRDTYTPGHRDTSNNTTRYAVKRIVEQVGNLPADRLRAPRVRQMWADLLAAGIAVRTLDQTRTTGHQAFKQAKRDGIVRDNPFDDAPVAGKREDVGRVISLDHARAFVAHCAGERYGLAIRLCLALGFRRGESAGIRLQDIDLERGVLSINGTLTYAPASGVQYGPAKTAKGRRRVSLPPALTEAIRAHMVQRAAEIAAMGWQDCGYLFIGVKRGQPIQPSLLNDTFYRIRAAANLPGDVRLHDMRHSYASFLHAEGVPIETISRALGHANTTITSNIYVHIFDAAVSAAASAMDALLTVEPLTLELPPKQPV